MIFTWIMKVFKFTCTIVKKFKLLVVNLAIGRLLLFEVWMKRWHFQGVHKFLGIVRSDTITTVILYLLKILNPFKEYLRNYLYSIFVDHLNQHPHNRTQKVLVKKYNIIVFIYFRKISVFILRNVWTISKPVWKL